LSAVGRELDVGPRQLRRRFQYQCGLSPKEFARLRRMRQTCMNILTSRSGRLAIAAVESGFTDQAHMAREFSKVFGDTTTLVMEHLASIEHGDFIKDLP
jgi:AraC-like DNA-binding protein